MQYVLPTMGQQVHVLRHDGIAGYCEGGYFAVEREVGRDPEEDFGVSRFRGSACVSALGLELLIGRNGILDWAATALATFC
jgi:hypothetical protein